MLMSSGCTHANKRGYGFQIIEITVRELSGCGVSHCVCLSIADHRGVCEGGAWHLKRYARAKQLQTISVKAGCDHSYASQLAQLAMRSSQKLPRAMQEIVDIVVIYRAVADSCTSATDSHL